jgi:hypothetical protein
MAVRESSIPVVDTGDRWSHGVRFDDLRPQRLAEDPSGMPARDGDCEAVVLPSY